LRRFSQKSKLSISTSELSHYDFDEVDSVDTSPIKKSSSDQALNDLGLQGGTKLWYGKDYVNFIVKDFEELDQPFKDLVDRNTTPRMAWHDLSCMVTGAAARDVARHFIERWNFTKFEKAKFHESYHWLIPKSYSTVDSIVPPKFLLRSHRVSCQVVCQLVFMILMTVRVNKINKF
jgi:phosphatidylserine/phosphatidylglycerophosphate/cardiolipin synthase-like enzyme